MAEKKATFTYGDGKKAVITIEPQVDTKVVMLKGDDGMTSYELAVKYLGFTGTLEDWIKAYTTPEDYFTRHELKMITQAEYDDLESNNKLVTGCYYIITDDTTLEDLESAIAKAKEEAVAESKESTAEALAKKLDKGDWVEYSFTYIPNTDIRVPISALDYGTYICDIVVKGTGDYSDNCTAYSLGLFSIYNNSGKTSGAVVSGRVQSSSSIYDLIVTISGKTATIRGDLPALGVVNYKYYFRLRKIASD